jgi:hypothetical protein
MIFDGLHSVIHQKTKFFRLYWSSRNFFVKIYLKITICFKVTVLLPSNVYLPNYELAMKILWWLTLRT